MTKILDAAVDCKHIEEDGVCEICEERGTVYVWYASDDDGERFCRKHYNEVVYQEVMSSRLE